MADDWFSGLLGGGSSDLYGDLLTDKQRKALLFKEIGGGLDEISRRAAEAGKPSLMPGGRGWLGSALSGYGAGANAAGEGMLKTMQTAQALRKAKRDQELTEQYFLPLLRDLTNKEKTLNLPPGSLTNALPKPPAAGVTPAPPGMPAAPLTPTAPPGAAPAAAGPAGVPPPGPGFLGPTNEELGAPPAAPGGTGLPARIGMKGTGPGAIMIDLDTGQPIQSSPGGPITPPSGSPAGLPAGMTIPPIPPGSGFTPADYGQKQSGLLPPADQVVGEDGQPLTGQGVLPGILASYTGGTPGGMPPFQLASATPTSGTIPGAAGPSRDDPRGVVPYIRERATALGIDPDVAERVARSEGVSSFQSTVIQKDGRREPSYGALQLYTGGGMGNDFQRDTGLDPSDPKNEKATIDYALQKARTGGWTPWHGAKGAGIGPRTGLPGGEDYVIPSGRGIPASALRNVADTGPAPGGGAPASGGTIPGTNMTPQGLAALNAMSKLLGHGDMFGTLLETYYKSPDYLKLKAQTEKDVEVGSAAALEKERRSVTEPSDIRIAQSRVAAEMTKDMALQGFQIDTKKGSPTEGQVVPVPGYWDIMKGREDDKQRLQQEWQAKMKISKQLVQTPDGKTVEMPMTDYEIQRRLQQQQMRGTGAPQPGDIVGTPYRSPEAVKGAEKSSELSVTAGWKALEDSHAREIDANRRLQSYGQLAEAMQGFRTGATAEAKLYWKGVLRDLGAIEGVDVPDGEVAQRAMRRLQLDAASVTKGSTSDYERGLIAQGSAQLGNSPEAVVKMIDQMRRLDEYDQKIAQIHRDVADKNGGTPNIIEAQRRIAALGPPLSPGEVKALERIREGKVPAGGPAAGGANTPKSANEIIQNGWRYDPTTHQPLGPVQ